MSSKNFILICCCLADLFWHLARRLIYWAYRVEPGGFLSMGECHFFYPISERSEVTDKKMTEHEVTAGAAPKKLRLQQP